MGDGLKGFIQRDPVSGGWAYYGVTETSDFEAWGSDNAIMAAGDYTNGPTAIFTATHSNFGQPFCEMAVEDYANNIRSSVVLLPTSFSINVPFSIDTFRMPK